MKLSRIPAACSSQRPARNVVQTMACSRTAVVSSAARRRMSRPVSTGGTIAEGETSVVAGRDHENRWPQVLLAITGCHADARCEPLRLGSTPSIVGRAGRHPALQRIHLRLRERVELVWHGLPYRRAGGLRFDLLDEYAPVRIARDDELAVHAHHVDDALRGIERVSQVGGIAGARVVAKSAFAGRASERDAVAENENDGALIKRVVVRAALNPLPNGCDLFRREPGHVPRHPFALYLRVEIGSFHFADQKAVRNIAWI